MYKELNNFLDYYFPNIEGCILFGSYIEKREKANDVDLLLVSDRFSFSSTESFRYNNFAYNVIKISISEVLNTIAKQFKQGNFLAHVFKTGIIICDKDKEISEIRNYIIKSVSDASTDAINFNLHEISYKIKDYSAYITQSPTLSIEDFLHASKLISLFIEYFILQKGIHHLKTEKAKNRYFFQNFHSESQRIINTIEALKSNDKKGFEKNIANLISDYSISASKKYSNNFILDDYTQYLLICYVENLFKFDEVLDLIRKIRQNSEDLKFFIYQIDEENQEKEGLYIVIDNSNLNVDRKKKDWITFFQNAFRDYNFIFPYNNIFCYPEIKFMGCENELIINKLMFSLIDSVHLHKDFGKEKIIFRIIKDFLDYSTINIDDIYNFYLIRMDAKAKTSNFLNNNSQKIENKFIKANQSIEHLLLQKFTLIQEKIIDLKSIQKIPKLIHLQILDRILSIFLSKDYEKLYYIHIIKLKNDEKFPKL